MAMVTDRVEKPEYTVGKRVALSGAILVAHAMRQTNPDVVAAYPVTPQTVITETFSEFVANGEVQTEFIRVESEHAAMSACIGAAAAGARAQTATAGPGLALMWEVLYVASGMRLPIVMHLCARSLSAPLDILCDHSDAMGMRDAGWVILFAENGQEAYDNGIQAVRIAEHPQVLLPVTSTLDGFVTTHAVEPADMLPDELVQRFVGLYEPPYSLLNADQPVSYGTLDFHDYYFEHKRQQAGAMEKALEVVPQVGREFGDLAGRYYGLIEPYRMEDAEVATVAMGSSVGTLRVAVDRLREEGVRAGLIKVRCYRPFPGREVVEALSSVEKVAVLDRALSFGAWGNPLFLDVSAALFTSGRSPNVSSWVYGLGGRNTTSSQFVEVYRELLSSKEGPARPGETRYVGLRE